jgi:type IV pilus assembly protein PilA
VKQKRRQSGFSLIELLIVVAIILIIAAIAIPSLLRAHISANEASAASSVRTTNSAQISFNSTYPTTGFSATMVALGPGAGNTTCVPGGPVVTAACLLDSTLSLATTIAASKSGYYFAMGVTTVGGVNTDYQVGGAAASFNISGVRGFCSNSDGVIRYDPDHPGPPDPGPATCSAAPYVQLQ